jgi:hypothetical protein
MVLAVVMQRRLMTPLAALELRARRLADMLPPDASSALSPSRG